MCRHLAYLGAPRTLHGLIVEPPFGLYRQAWAPRRQRHGTVNADGFGAGWYLPGRAEPVRYRRAQPIWSDASFASLAPTIASGCVLAAVRDATVGQGADESCAAPMAYDRWLFSHNGALADPELTRKAVQDRISWVPDARAPVDSALLFGLAVAAWQAGAPLADGLSEAVRAVADAGGGRLTALATDGVTLAGITWGEPLYLRTTGTGRVPPARAGAPPDTAPAADGSLPSPGGTVLAAEPDDDGTDWTELDDRSLITVTPTGVAIRGV